MSKTSEGFARAIDRTYDQAIDDAVKVVRGKAENYIAENGLTDAANCLVVAVLCDTASLVEAMKDAKT